MKRCLTAISIGLLIWSCGNGATDQDARTDTTTMPADTNLNTDTSNHINRADGTRMLDTSGKDSTR